MKHTNLSGPLTIPMTNDYLFRALLQQNNKVLKGLISSLLHLQLEEIVSVEITNPIELGKSIDSKTFFLDIKVLLNSNTIINLEMQVINEHNWPERSLSYLCRSFDDLNKGDGYLEVTPVIQISLLDFTLFPDNPEFYATYQLLNVKNYIKYSDKLCLHVLDLNRTDIATEEDKQYHIDYWAALFKTTTWEELRMLAKKNDAIADAIETVYMLSEDEMIRLQCEAREDYYRCQRDIQLQMEWAREDYERRQRDTQILLERAERGKQEALIQIQEAQQQLQEVQLQAQEAQQQVQEAQLQAQEAQQQIQEAQLQAKEAHQQVQEALLQAQEAQLQAQEANLQLHTLMTANEELSIANQKQTAQIELLTAELEKLRAEQTG